MSPIPDATLSGDALRQMQVMDQLDEAGLLNAKQLARLLQVCERVAFRIKAADRLLTLGELQILVGSNHLPPQARELLAGLVLDGTGVIAIDLEGRAASGASAPQDMTASVHATANAIDEFVAAVTNDGVVNEAEGARVQLAIEQAIACLASASQTVRLLVKAGRRQVRQAHPPKSKASLRLVAGDDPTLHPAPERSGA